MPRASPIEILDSTLSLESLCALTRPRIVRALKSGPPGLGMPRNGRPFPHIQHSRIEISPDAHKGLLQGDHDDFRNKQRVDSGVIERSRDDSAIRFSRFGIMTKKTSGDLVFFSLWHNVIIIYYFFTEIKCKPKVFVPWRPKARGTTPKTIQSVCIAPWAVPSPMM